jgi:ferrous iron transport protein B
VTLKRVILLGQPNVGKSSLLNALTGASVQVSNYPGTTVEVTKAKTRINGVEYEFIDTPGIYNLYPSSLEEEVTERVVLEGNYDFAIVIIDATAVERGLAFLISVAELGIPMIVAFNFWEEAEAKGIIIDYRGLERILGVPVVKINPLKRGGLRELISRFGEARRPRVKVPYDDHIERAIEKAMKCIPENVKLSRRGLAVRLVEEDPLVWRMYGCPAAEQAVEELRKSGHNPHQDIESQRAGYALLLARRYVRVHARPRAVASRFEARLVERPLLAGLVSLAILAATIAVTVYLGGKLIDLIDSAVGPYVDSLTASLEKEGLLGFTAAKTVEALYAQYAAALPYVFVFYLVLILFEDVGILPRLMLWLYSFTRRLGIHPKGVIPALLGLGCSVPAVMSTRILPGRKQRIAVAAMLAFIPCSSRATTIFAVAGRIAGAWAPMLIYFEGFLIAAFVGYIVSKITGGWREAIMIEDIPPIRKPMPKVVASKAWARFREFIVIVTPLVALGAVLYAVLAYTGYAETIESILAPFAAPLHLPPKALIPAVYGFLQKDLVVSMLAAVYGTANLASVMTPTQALIFTMLSTYQIPCIIAFLMMIREFGAKRATLMLITLDSIGYAITALHATLLAYFAR